MDMAVPDVLVSGDHGAVRRWRLKASLRRTLLRRPDLLEGRVFTSEERTLLDEIGRELDAPTDGAAGPGGDDPAEPADGATATEGPAGARPS